MVLGQYILNLFLRAFQNIRENRFLTVVTVAVIAVSVFLFSFFLLLYHNIEASLESWGHDVQVSAYLLDSVTEEQAREIMVEIAALPEVIEASYVSKEEALQSFSSSLKGVSGIVDDLGTNPLPASIEIKLLENIENTESIETFVNGIKRTEFEDIDWSQEWVEKFYGFLSLLRWSGIVLGGLLAAASVFIISQTIKLGFYARKDEFEILELVGATRHFIRVPFLIEGVVQGLTGALVADGLLYVVYWVVASLIDAGLKETLGALSFHFLPFSTLADITLGGMVLGLLGSFLSSRNVARVGVE